MMKFPTEWKSIKSMFKSPPTRYVFIFFPVSIDVCRRRTFLGPWYTRMHHLYHWWVIKACGSLSWPFLLRGPRNLSSLSGPSNPKISQGPDLTSSYPLHFTIQTHFISPFKLPSTAIFTLVVFRTPWNPNTGCTGAGGAHHEVHEAHGVLLPTELLGALLQRIVLGAEQQVLVVLLGLLSLSCA